MKQPSLLAIDTTTEACSAALLNQNKIIERFELQPRQQSQLILKLVDDLLKQAKLTVDELDAITFTVGPGSFTGLRIGAGVVQGLAFGANLPVIPVSTLATVAQGIYREHSEESVLVALDARMEEVYWGVYALKEGIMRPLQPDSVIVPDKAQVNSSQKSWVGAGSGWSVYSKELNAAVGKCTSEIYDDFYPHAQDSIPLALEKFRQGKTVSAEKALPVYLRDKVV